MWRHTNIGDKSKKLKMNFVEKISKNDIMKQLIKLN